MKNHTVVLDTCRYTVKENGTCILRGWMYVGEEDEPFVQVRADHIPLECTMTRWARPDVLAARPDIPFADENAGFEIRIPNMEHIFSLAESLRVRICADGETYPVMQKDMALVRQEYFDDTLNFFFEHIEKRFDNVYIQGWCINTVGELSMELMDDKGETQKKAHWNHVRRPDLPEQFGVTEEQCHGFIIEVPRGEIKSRNLHFAFKNSVTAKEHVIDMHKFDRENATLGRILKTVNLKNRTKNKELIHELGVKGFIDYVKEESNSFVDSYAYYEKKHRVTPRELRIQGKEAFSPAPLFSIVVPLYHTPLEYLKELVDSVLKQSYGNWQLCLADGSRDNAVEEYIQKNYGKDRRIFYQHLTENTGIAGNTNAALAMAEGDYVVFADHDDTLAADALYHAAKVAVEYPKTELIYSDEDLMDEKGNFVYPHFKPDFNLDLLRCINYICHMVVVKRSLLDKVGELRSEFDGAQDYDFLLRCAENTAYIRHIPRVLYHWRSYEGSTAGNQSSKNYAVDAGKRALEEHYRRLGIPAEVEFTGIFIIYRTRFLVQDNPKVSILIPNKDHIEDLETCVSSIQEKTTWKNYEIVVIENNSEQEETFAYYEKLKRRFDNVKVVRYEGPFNYSAINNFGAGYAEGDYYLLLNNDTEVINPDWLTLMLGCCQREDTAIVGATLYYPDDTVQHAGVVIGMGGFAGHILTGFGKNHAGYLGRLKAMQETSAVTAACLMVKRSVFEEINGLDEEFTVALNDVDFCLRAGEIGKKVVFLPDATLYHYESKSRGFETTPEKQERFQREISRFQERYADLLAKGDPYYNPNLSLVKNDCSLKRAHEGRI